MNQINSRDKNDEEKDVKLKTDAGIQARPNI